MSQPFDQREAAKYLLKLKRASLSFPGFMDYYYDLEWPGFMREFQEVLDLLEKDALVSPGGNPVRNVLVSMPPRHAKSFNGTVNFPAYALMRKPYREVMVSGYNNELATTFGRSTRDIVTDVKVAKAFPKVQLSRDTRAVDFWKTQDGGAYYAVGLNGSTTGRGANLLVVDDPYKTREEAESLTNRRKVWDYYVASLLTRLQPDMDGQPAIQIVTHTRWHPDDLAGRIMETPEFKAGEWVHLNFKALSVKDRGVYIRRSNLPASDPRYVPDNGDDSDPISRLMSYGMANHDRVVSNEHEEALWPQRFPVEWLHKQRSIIGEREFAALYQQEPYVIGGNLLKEGWLRRYKPDELPEFVATVFGVDTAFKTKVRNDYSVFTLGGVTDLGDIYILRVWREKLEFPDLKRKAVALNAAYRGRGLRGFWIEDAASGQSLLQELKRETALPVMPWRPGTVDKVVKANSIAPIVESGRVWIPEEADWLDDWLQEIITFPSSKNDDQVDSFVITVDTLSKMVVTGQQAWAAPIGDFLRDKAFEASAFNGVPIEADPKGWLGSGGLGGALKGMEGQFDKTWRGWGE